MEVFDMKIKSSTALRNGYNTVSNLAHETQEPIYITKNGEGDLVLWTLLLSNAERKCSNSARNCLP